MVSTFRQAPTRKGEYGFALVVAVSLMVLLLLLAVSVLTLASVSIRQTNTDDAMMEAQANARMALMIAIGELQESMGPDRRISARASVLGQDERIGLSVSASSPKAWWVGVAGTNPNFGIDGESAVSADNPAAVWLVSGLDPRASTGGQLSQGFANPVIMFGDQSIDLGLTGGQPLEAGIVRVDGAKRGRIGGYAYFIDDESLKATLVPNGAQLVNTDSPRSDSDLTPGAYDVSILNGMNELAGNPLSNYAKILSINDMELIGGSDALVANKRFSFTTYSRGVLCDVKNGGLKRDLTVAFEDDTTFNEVFPSGGYGNYTADYLCIDPDKLADSPELQKNGYIHFEVFKDHYNTKRYIQTHTDGVTKYLDPVRYTKDGPALEFRFNGTINPRDDPNGFGGYRGSYFTAGRLGPHEIGDDRFVFDRNESQTYTQCLGLPYGDYFTSYPEWYPATNWPEIKKHMHYKHSPVIPILQRLQMNAWMEYRSADTIRTHCQLWTSHYNPYNIAMWLAGDRNGASFFTAPMIRASTTNSHINRNRFRYLHENYSGDTERWTDGWIGNIDFDSGNHSYMSDDPVMALPGRSHVLAFERATQIGKERIAWGAVYNDKVKDLTVESIYRDWIIVEPRTVPRDDGSGRTMQVWDVPSELPLEFDIKLNMQIRNAVFNHGLDDSHGNNFELCQTFWAPFAWDEYGGKPGKIFDLGSRRREEWNENIMASLGFNLRTTREADGVRPLVDSNIRCLFGNTRWDSPLNLPVLSSYTPMDQNEMDEMIMQMSTVDAPRGYTYWGAGRSPSFGYDRVILFDIPRSDLVSLGQLQHANAGRFSYEPTYIVGNSYANPRISQANWVESVRDTYSNSRPGMEKFPIDRPFNLYDASYLVNEVLWDGYTFTTIPQVADNVNGFEETEPNDSHYRAIAMGDAKLPNARFLPYTPQGSNFDMETLKMASNKENRTGAFYHNAGHVLIDGAFNVNSTSVDAWEAFLSSTHSLPVAKVNKDGEMEGFDALDKVRFPRVQAVFGDGMTTDDMDENFWMGFRELKQPEVRQLAQAVVAEVQKRGPFLSMADFVNRDLVAGELGEAGALQAALDITVNADIDSEFGLGDQGKGFPGQLLQGDVLQALAPRMTVRSDVFTIRAYGETVSEKTGEVIARAWCEAKVQRFPEPINWGGSNSDFLAELANPTSPFGREFRLISFRWLNPEEI